MSKALKKALAIVLCTMIAVSVSACASKKTRNNYYDTWETTSSEYTSSIDDYDYSYSDTSSYTSSDTSEHSEADSKICNITPNKWYTYKPWSEVNVKNCIVVSATPIGSSDAMVQYMPVCSSCLHGGDTAHLAGPEYGYPVNKTYICPDCGAYTTITIRLGTY
ncbi:MAG: hypothetical protein K6F76_04210 [Clostridiales bacterium]|nr:hypothetical protein [Clostridiales bacterium]